MPTSDFETWLTEAIEAQRADADDDPIRRVETYRETGILTTDRGLVVTFEDGSEIQVTLVRSRPSRSGDDEGDA